METFLMILIATVLFFGWIAALFALVFDSISIGAKIVWFVLLTLLAPITVPLYFVLRRRRHAAVATS